MGERGDDDAAANSCNTSFIRVDKRELASRRQGGPIDGPLKRSPLARERAVFHHRRGPYAEDRQGEPEDERYSSSPICGEYSYFCDHVHGHAAV